MMLLSVAQIALVSFGLEASEELAHSAWKVWLVEDASTSTAGSRRLGWATSSRVRDKISDSMEGRSWMRCCGACCDWSPRRDEQRFLL